MGDHVQQVVDVGRTGHRARHAGESSDDVLHSLGLDPFLGRWQVVDLSQLQVAFQRRAHLGLTRNSPNVAFA